MTRYYFDMIDDRGSVVDDAGLILADLDAAQEEAAKTLGDMARDASRIGTVARNMSIVVRDDAGLVLQVSFSFKVERRI